MTPLISVIIATHKRPSLLRRAIQSVLEQGVITEIIVCADEDTEPTKTAATSLLRKSDTFLCYPNMRGPASTRNAGINVAKGQWIYFLDDDDSIKNGFFHKLSPLLRLHENQCVLYTNYAVVHEHFKDGREWVVRRKEFNVAKRKQRDLYINNFIPLHSFFTPRKFLHAVQFDEQLSSHEDWDLVLGLKRKYNFTHVDLDGPIYRQQTSKSRNDITSESHRKIYKKIYQKHKTLNPFIWMKRRRFLERQNISKIF